MDTYGTRIINQESFGYSVLTTAPTALLYHDMRFGTNPVKAAGDGQSYTYGISVTPDGQRLAVGIGGPGDGWGTVVGSPDAGEGFTFWGSFGDDRPTSVLVKQSGSRYTAYSFTMNGVKSADVTTLPTALAQLNITATLTGWPGGYAAHLAGEYIVYMTATGVEVVNTATGATMTLTAASFAGRVPQYATGAVVNGTLWVFAELRPATGETSPSYGLLELGKSATIWRVPAAAGETWGQAGLSALIANGKVYMPAVRFTPSQVFRIYSVALGAFGTAPAVYQVPATQGFGFGMPATAGPTGIYLPTGPAGFVIPWGCL